MTGPVVEVDEADSDMSDDEEESTATNTVTTEEKNESSDPGTQEKTTTEIGEQLSVLTLLSGPGLSYRATIQHKYEDRVVRRKQISPGKFVMSFIFIGGDYLLIAQENL